MTFILWKLVNGKKETVAEICVAVSRLKAKEQKSLLRVLYKDRYDFDGIDSVNY